MVQHPPLETRHGEAVVFCLRCPERATHHSPGQGQAELAEAWPPPWVYRASTHRPSNSRSIREHTTEAETKTHCRMNCVIAKPREKIDCLPPLRRGGIKGGVARQRNDRHRRPRTNPHGRPGPSAMTGASSFPALDSRLVFPRPQPPPRPDAVQRLVDPRGFISLRRVGAR
jgi:hypothetical protein